MNMRKKFKIFACLLAVVLLVGCAEPIIGGRFVLPDLMLQDSSAGCNPMDEIDEPAPPPPPPEPPRPPDPPPPHVPGQPRPATGDGRIAITFDDGPSIWTNRILDHIEGTDVRLTFYVVGERLHNTDNRDMVLRAYNAGHEIGNHSYSHPWFTRISNDRLRRELTQTSDLIEEIIGSRPITMRPPYGDFRRSRNYGYAVILWNVDPSDWDRNRSVDAIYNNIMANIQTGGIVVMHDMSERSYLAFVRALDSLQRLGYNLVTVSELLDIPPQGKPGYTFRSRQNVTSVNVPVFDGR